MENTFDPDYWFKLLGVPDDGLVVVPHKELLRLVLFAMHTHQNLFKLQWNDRGSATLHPLVLDEIADRWPEGRLQNTSAREDVRMLLAEVWNLRCLLAKAEHRAERAALTSDEGGEG